MLFVLAVLVGVLVGYVALVFARKKTTSDVVRAVAAVVGFIVGYYLTYLVYNELS